MAFEIKTEEMEYWFKASSYMLEHTEETEELHDNFSISPNDAKRSLENLNKLKLIRPGVSAWPGVEDYQDNNE